MRVALHTTSPAAIARAAQAFCDAKLQAHEDANAIWAANDRAARANVKPIHYAEAMVLVEEEIQNQIDSGELDQALGHKLLNLFERINDVAVEASWADLARENEL